MKTWHWILLAVVAVGFLFRDKLAQIWGAIVTVNKNQKSIDKASAILGKLPEQGAGSIGDILAAGSARLSSWLRPGVPETTASAATSKPPAYTVSEQDVIVSPTAVADDTGNIPILPTLKEPGGWFQ